MKTLSNGRAKRVGLLLTAAEFQTIRPIIEPLQSGTSSVTVEVAADGFVVRGSAAALEGITNYLSQE